MRAPLLTPNSLRLDSRLPLELRSLSFQILPSPPSTSAATPIVPSGADGYALVSHGLTRVSASVFGPREAMRVGAFSGGNTGGGAGDKAVVNVEVGVAGWSERVGGSAGAGGLRKGGKDKKIVELASSLKATFEPVLLLHLYPRSSIDIYIQVLELDGGLLQAAVNATTLALIAAGLPLSDYVCAISLASYPSLCTPVQVAPFTLDTPIVPFSNRPPSSLVGGPSETAGGTGSTTLLDLTTEEERSLPSLTLAVLPRSGKITLVSLEMRVGVGRFEEMMRWGVEASVVVRGAMDEAVAVWAASLAKPVQDLAGLFPGCVAVGGTTEKKESQDDDMEE